jgi:hypothetical protein
MVGQRPVRLHRERPVAKWLAIIVEATAEAVAIVAASHLGGLPLMRILDQFAHRSRRRGLEMKSKTALSVVVFVTPGG